MTDLQHDQQDRTDEAAEDRSLSAVPLFASHPDAPTVAPPVADLVDVGWSTSTPAAGEGVRPPGVSEVSLTFTPPPPDRRTPRLAAVEACVG